MKQLLILLIGLCSVFTQAAEVHIAFTGNNRGLLTPCGCIIPSGGWPRIFTAMEYLPEPYLLAGSGNHFFSRVPRSGDDQIFEQRKAVLQAELFSEAGFDVINVGEFDLCYGLRFLQSLETRFDLPFVSANLLDPEGNPAFPPYRILSRAGLDIAFIGICTVPERHNFRVRDPLGSLKQILESGIRDDVDLVVVLADAYSGLLTAFVAETPGIDHVVFSKGPVVTGLPAFYGKTALTQVGAQGKYLSLLTLHIEDLRADREDLSMYAENIRAAEDALAAVKNESTRVRRPYERELRKQRNTLRRKRNAAANYMIWDLILLDKHIADRPDIKQRVLEFDDYPEE
jgi:hypothetical protein